MKKLIAFKESLNEDIVKNKREYILTLLVCVLSGILFGMLFSPKRESTIGSFNGNGCFVKNPDDNDTTEDEE